MMTRAETMRLLTWAVAFFCTSLAAYTAFVNKWGLSFVPQACIVAGLLLIALAMSVVAAYLPKS